MQTAQLIPLSTMLCPVDNHNNELQHPHSQYYNYYTYIQHLNYLSYHKNCKEHTNSHHMNSVSSVIWQFLHGHHKQRRSDLGQ